MVQKGQKNNNVKKLHRNNLELKLTLELVPQESENKKKHLDDLQKCFCLKNILYYHCHLLFFFFQSPMVHNQPASYELEPVVRSPMTIKSLLEKEATGGSQG